jgi:hypothetical protein
MFNRQALPWAAEMKMKIGRLSPWHTVAWRELEALAIMMLRFAR